MRILNRTDYDVDALLCDAVNAFEPDGLTVEIKYCPQGSRRYVSGTYYRRTRNYDDGRMIRIRVNRQNRYPLTIPFKTSEYFRKRTLRGEVRVYQKLVKVTLGSAEHLILAIFLHEFSHYLDHAAGRNGRYKQTKADKFATETLRRMGICLPPP